MGLILTEEEIRGIQAARRAANAINDYIPNSNKQAIAEGAAISRVRHSFGVVARRPPKKRRATSGCGPTNRKFHGRLSALPAASHTPSVKPPKVIIGGRTAKDEPFKATIICHFPPALKRKLTLIRKEREAAGLGK